MKYINLILLAAAPVIAGLLTMIFGNTAMWIYVATHLFYILAGLSLEETKRHDRREA